MKKIDEKTTVREAISWVIALVIITMPITGCGLSTIAMTPNLKSMSDIRINKSVRIMDVTGGKKRTSYWAVVPNEEFKEALIATIEKSNIFKAVTVHDSDLDLYATIKRQDQLDYGFSTRARLMVGYKFINNDDGRVIWHETYLSEFGSYEDGIREQLSFFIEGINKRWPNKSE
ncbi:MAG: hypothetical protein ACUZ77_07265 [Candidatus Brocadiales bacterium]